MVAGVVLVKRMIFLTNTTPAGLRPAFPSSARGRSPRKPDRAQPLNNGGSCVNLQVSAPFFSPGSSNPDFGSVDGSCSGVCQAVAQPACDCPPPGPAHQEPASASFL